MAEGAADVIVLLAELAEDRGWKAPEVGRRMGFTGQWWRDIAAGRKNMTVADAVRLAELLGARITLASDDPLRQLEVAVGALPRPYVQLRRHLHAVVRDERHAAVAVEGTRHRPPRAARQQRAAQS